MRAVILAGGEGSRLRPLTCDLPKPLVRLCGRPAMDYILDLLGNAGVTQACVTLRYLAEEIQQYYQDGKYKNIELEFIVEDKPLGTAGGVRNAAADFNDDFIVISGDALCDFELSAAMAFHKEKQAIATILVKQVDDPREYGLVDIDQDGKVRGFIEKPGWSQAFADTANTGIYILSRRCLDFIPRDKASDFAKDIFPQILEQGGLYAFTGKGYWCDIGDLTSYMTSQYDMLKGRVDYGLTGLRNDGIFFRDAVPMGQYTLRSPVYIGEGVQIGNGAVIGPDVILDDGVTVGPGARIVSSVMLQDSYLGENAQLTGALVCRGGVVKKGSSLFEGSVLGFNSVIGENTVVGPGVLIWPEKQVASGLSVRENIKIGKGPQITLEEDGIRGEAGGDMTPDQAVRLGAALSGAVKGAAIGIASDGSNMAEALKNAFSAGVLGAGGEVYEFGEMFTAQLSFAVDYCAVSCGVLFESDGVSGAQMVFPGGQGMQRSVERDLDARLSKGDYPHCLPSECKSIRHMSGMGGVYFEQIKNMFSGKMNGVRADFISTNPKVEAGVRRLFSRLGGIVDSSLTVSLDYGGRSVSFIEGDKEILSQERVQAVCALISFEKGKDIWVPRSAPRALEHMASSYGCKVNRITDGRGMSRWVHDGIVAAFTILSEAKTIEGLKKLICLLPEFAVVSRVFPAGKPAGLMGRLLKEAGSIRHEDGVELSNGTGHVLVRPLRNGSGIRIIAEAYSVEAAEELCDGFEQKARSAQYPM